MAWFKIDDQATFHPKIVRAGNAAFGALVRMGAYCNAQLTDGFVPTQIAETIASKREIDSLKKNDLIHEVSDGFLLHDYLEYQPSREQILKQRDAIKARVSRHRNGSRNAVTNGDSNGSGNHAPVPIPSRSKYNRGGSAAGVGGLGREEEQRPRPKPYSKAYLTEPSPDDGAAK